MFEIPNPLFSKDISNSFLNGKAKVFFVFFENLIVQHALIVH